MDEGAVPSTPPTQRPAFAEGMKLHNDGLFFEAHEAWETLWQREANEQHRLFVQGLIQVTSAFHKLLVQRQPPGAARLLTKGLAKLAAYPPDYLGVALGPFRERAEVCRVAIAALEPTSEAASRFDRATVPQLTWEAHDTSAGPTGR